MPGNGFRLDTDFRKLWMGQAISQIGSNITGVGLPLTAVLVLKASPLQMGFLSGAGAAAVLIFGLFAGAWVDRLRRRPILIAADLGRAVVLGIIPLAAMLHRLTNRLLDSLPLRGDRNIDLARRLYAIAGFANVCFAGDDW